MTEQHLRPTDQPQFRVGLGGNHYVYCLKREPVLDIARAIGRAPSGVYWKDRFKCWALRVRGERPQDRRAKAQLKAIFGKGGGQTTIWHQEGGNEHG